MPTVTLLHREIRYVLTPHERLRIKEQLRRRNPALHDVLERMAQESGVRSMERVRHKIEKELKEALASVKERAHAEANRKQS